MNTSSIIIGIALGVLITVSMSFLADLIIRKIGKPKEVNVMEALSEYDEIRLRKILHLKQKIDRDMIHAKAMNLVMSISDKEAGERYLNKLALILTDPEDADFIKTSHKLLEDRFAKNKQIIKATPEAG